MPTYNRADGYLRNALQSALNQTYPNLEIIISDNCSDDNTEAVVASFHDSRICYYRQRINIGPQNNFNFCLEQANGAYFLLLHDDDMIDTDFMETCLKAASYKTDYHLIRTGIRVIDDSGNPVHESPNRIIGPSFEEFILSWFRKQTAWCLCNTLFNTAALRDMGGFKSKRKLLQDGMAIARLAASGPHLDIVEAKASFRKHQGEITFAVKVQDWMEDFFDLLDLICRLSAKDQHLIRNEGERFFAELSYKRAMNVKAPLERWWIFLVVFKKFRFRYFPPPVRRVGMGLVRRIKAKEL
jgi:glycosyltransferase involved in cell wall biosynthesis